MILVGVLALAHLRSEELTVFAAASLRESLTAIARSFESEHPGTRVRMNFAGSQQLAAGIKLGAPVDVFASAGPEPLQGLGIPKKDWTVFARNRMALVVPKGSRRVTGLRDLARPMRLVIADRKVPAGSYTLSVLAKAERRLGAAWRKAVENNVVSREADVRSVLAKVALYEADAGFVYVTDLSAAGAKVEGIAIPGQFNLETIYAAIVAPRSPSPALSRAFVSVLRSPAARREFAARGFLAPP